MSKTMSILTAAQDVCSGRCGQVESASQIAVGAVFAPFLAESGGSRVAFCTIFGFMSTELGADERLARPARAKTPFTINS